MVAAGADGWLRFRVALAKNLHWVVDFYGKYSGPVAAGLATLACFTFFGLRLGESSEDLQLQINITGEEYAQVAKRTETELSERVATYRNALALPEQIDNLVATVQKHADRAKSDYEVNIPEIEKMIHGESARIKKVNELSPDLTIRGESRQSTPGTTTYNQVKAAKKALDAHPGGEGIEVVNEGRKRVVLHIEKIISEQLVKLTESLANAVPALEPLLQPFVEAMDKTL